MFFEFTDDLKSDHLWNTNIIPEYNVETRLRPTSFSFYSKKLKGEILCMTGGGLCEKSNTVEILNLKNFPKTIQEKSKSDSHDFEMKWILVKHFTFPIENLWCYRSLSLNG